MFIYEIYIKSFNKSKKSSEFGDIKGIIKKAEYLSNLGVDAIWITPFYPSPLVDNGYDVANYIEVDERLGTIEDFKELLSTFHGYGIKVFIDVVFNHSSDKHAWFQKALEGETKYQDYYIFEKNPVNNWESMFKGDAWTYAPTIDKYYLHRFAKEQPDLNYMNNVVKDELKNILKYWSKIGVDGFRFDVINFLITDKKLYNTNNNNDVRNDLNMPGTYTLIRELKEYMKSINPDVIFIGEIGSDDINILQSYVGEDLMDFVFTFNVSSLDTLDVEKLGEELTKTYKVIDNPTIFFSSHDMSRFYRRLAKYDDDLYFMIIHLMFSLKGIKIFFQGDENQTQDFECKSIEEMQDIQSRNEYKELLKAGEDPKTAFKKSLKSNRDFSRNFVEFEKNTEVLNKVQALIKKYNTDFYMNSEISSIKYDKDTISFTRSNLNEKIKFKFDFKNKKIEEIYE